MKFRLIFLATMFHVLACYTATKSFDFLIPDTTSEVMMNLLYVIAVLFIWYRFDDERDIKKTIDKRLAQGRSTSVTITNSRLKNKIADTYRNKGYSVVLQETNTTSKLLIYEKIK